MPNTRVPTWHSATGLQNENRRVYALFQAVLHNLPMSYTVLADRIGVSQPAVSRWAAGDARPSLEEMEAVFEAVRTEIDEVERHLEAFGSVLVLVKQALELYRSAPASADSESQIRRIARRLSERLATGAPEEGDSLR